MIFIYFSYIVFANISHYSLLFLFFLIDILP